MSLKHLADRQLLANMKAVAAEERHVLTKVLQHLREIERRRLYADLGYASLFDYAVNELRYSEGHASRRIAAMRLLKEIPQVEKSLANGELSLSNVCQAQSLFRNQKKQDPEHPMSKGDKISVLNKLKHKSTREGQRELLKLQSPALDCRAFEKEKIITPEASEVRFLMSDRLKEKLEAVKALLGPKAVGMGYSELIEAMAELSQQKLAENKFGKKRTAAARRPEASKAKPAKTSAEQRSEVATPAPAPDKSERSKIYKSPRYLPQAVKHAVWQRDGGRCTNCKSRHQLNYDHVRPVAMGGVNTVENLRLLCFSCNQRQAIKTFGLEQIEHRKMVNTKPRRRGLAST